MICALALPLLLCLRGSHGRAHRPARTRLRAFGIGLLHGAAGSAAVGVLLLAAIGPGWTAVGALGLFSACTALWMALVSSGLGAVLAAPRARALLPALGALTLLFGAWYALQATSF